MRGSSDMLSHTVCSVKSWPYKRGGIWLMVALFRGTTVVDMIIQEKINIFGMCTTYLVKLQQASFPRSFPPPV